MMKYKIFTFNGYGLMYLEIMNPLTKLSSANAVTQVQECIFIICYTYYLYLIEVSRLNLTLFILGEFRKLHIQTRTNSTAKYTQTYLKL